MWSNCSIKSQCHMDYVIFSNLRQLIILLVSITYMLQLQNCQTATILQCDVRYMSKDDIQVTIKTPATRSFWVAAFAACWLSAAVAGLFVLWSYENAPGVAAAAHEQWPAETALKLAADRPTLVFLAHPQCVCTGASVGEL